LAGFKVQSVRDLGVGLDTSQADGKALLPWVPGDLNITLTLEGGAELTLRASGTEPKLKYYLEVAGGEGEGEGELQARAAALEAAIADELVKPAESGLRPKGA
jgi:phosphomannomutase